MLPEPLRLLICAYAAGDLSPRRKSAAERLLRHSAEARRLLKDVRFNRRRLRMLPRPKLPGDFAEKVLAALPPEKPPIIRPSTVTLHERSPISAASRWAAAAVVLVALATRGGGGRVATGRATRGAAGRRQTDKSGPRSRGGQTAAPGRSR